MIEIGFCAAYTAFAFGFALHCARFVLAAVRSGVGDLPTMKGGVSHDAFVPPLREERSLLRSAVRVAPCSEDA
jgi:hypothetical protein